MKKSIIVGLLCTVILFGFTGCFHWFERAATYQEKYVFVADTTIKIEDSIQLQLKGNMENLRLYGDRYLSAEEKAAFFTNTHTLSFYIAYDSIVGLREDKKMADRYRTEFRYFDELMARFDTIMLCQKTDTIVIWTPISAEYKNPFLQSNWRLDKNYTETLSPGNMRGFAYYIGKSDIEKLRIKKEKVGR